MSENIFYSNASVVMDTTVIELTISKVGTSYVSIDFSSATPWALNSYTYDVRLDASGLTLGDTVSLGDWTVTSTADIITASLSFGAGGMPFDEAIVEPDPSIDTPGDTYSFDVGEGGGTYDLATGTVPEPASLDLILLGLAAAGGAIGRRSLSCEK